MEIYTLETPSDIPLISELWETVANFDSTDTSSSVTEADIAKTLFLDKTRLMNALAVMQISIAARAIRACEVYFDWMRKRQGTDKQTYLRPRIRVDGRYNTVEMSWVRRLSKTQPYKPGDKVDNPKLGKMFRLNTQSGPITVFTWYSYLKKGAGDRYSDSIFKDEPAWVQKLGSELEDQFELLRKEQKHLSSIRRSLGIIHRTQTKAFGEAITDELSKSNMTELKCLYEPKINSDSAKGSLELE